MNLSEILSSEQGLHDLHSVFGFSNRGIDPEKHLNFNDVLLSCENMDTLILARIKARELHSQMFEYRSTYNDSDAFPEKNPYVYFSLGGMLGHLGWPPIQLGYAEIRQLRDYLDSCPEWPSMEKRLFRFHNVTGGFRDDREYGRWMADSEKAARAFIRGIEAEEAEEEASETGDGDTAN